MNTETLQLSDLRKENAVVPQVKYVAPPVDAHDDIINNTFVEDQVLNTDGALLNGTIAQRIQRLNDKKNKYKLLNRQYDNVQQQFLEEHYGQGITALGRRAAIASEQNRLHGLRTDVAADIEDLRGNIESAQALRKEALKTGAVKDKQVLLAKDYVLKQLKDNVSKDAYYAFKDLSYNDLIKLIKDDKATGFNKELKHRLEEAYNIVKNNNYLNELDLISGENLYNKDDGGSSDLKKSVDALIAQAESGVDLDNTKESETIKLFK